MIITVEDDSHSIKPLSVSCFASKWTIQSVVKPRFASFFPSMILCSWTLPDSSCGLGSLWRRNTPWEGSSSVVVQMLPTQDPQSSSVALVQGARISPLEPNDPFLRAAHARVIENERAVAKVGAFFALFYWLGGSMRCCAMLKRYIKIRPILKRRGRN